MTFEHGHVYVIYCSFIKIPHEKISLCICNKDHYFFWFNSNPNVPPIDQLAIKAGEHQAISKDCFLDISNIKSFPQSNLDTAKARGPISASMKARLLAALEAIPEQLPARHRQLALKNLK